MWALCSAPWSQGWLQRLISSFIICHFAPPPAFPAPTHLQMLPDHPHSEFLIFYSFYPKLIPFLFINSPKLPSFSDFPQWILFASTFRLLSGISIQETGPLPRLIFHRWSQCAWFSLLLQFSGCDLWYMHQPFKGQWHQFCKANMGDLQGSRHNTNPSGDPNHKIIAFQPFSL